MHWEVVLENRTSHGRGHNIFLKGANGTETKNPSLVDVSKSRGRQFLSEGETTLLMLLSALFVLVQ
jgi:hypothetical protein